MPGVWHEQVETYGIQTAVLFHRWGNRHDLVRFMMSDPEWTLVFHDYVAVIFVRRPGNEDVIARALAEFPKRRQRALDALAAPNSSLWSWQVPVSRLVALETYTRLLSTIGRADDNVELYELLLSFGPPRSQEQRVRVSLGHQLERRGDTAQALVHLQRALDLKPDDAYAKDLIERLGG